MGKIIDGANSRPQFGSLFHTLLVCTVAIGAMPVSASAQLVYVARDTGGGVAEYRINGGSVTTLNANFITGVNASALMLSGDSLYVTNTLNNTIGEYDATTGAVINANLISGLHDPGSAVLSGDNLYVANYTTGTIGKYSATTGAVINASLIPGTGFDVAPLSLSGNTLYRGSSSSYPNSKVGEYNATTGAAMRSNFISGLLTPTSIAVSGNFLFLAQGLTSPVEEFNATTGALINPAFGPSNLGVEDLTISGNNLFEGNFLTGTVTEVNATTGSVIEVFSPTGGAGAIAASPVPETSQMVLIGGVLSSALGLTALRRRQQKIRSTPCA